MADLDIRALTRKVDALEGSVRRLGASLDRLEKTAAEFVRILKATQKQEGVPYKVDEEYLRNQPPETRVEPEEQSGS